MRPWRFTFAVHAAITPSSPGVIPTTTPTAERRSSKSTNRPVSATNSGGGISARNISKDTAPIRARVSMCSGWSPMAACMAMSTWAFSSIRDRFCAKASGVVVGGLVVGISITEVTPPTAAAMLPLRKSSLCSAPGSRKWTWASTNPGNTHFPAASRRRTSLALSPSSPISATRPSFIPSDVRWVPWGKTTSPSAITRSRSVNRAFSIRGVHRRSERALTRVAALSRFRSPLRIRGRTACAPHWSAPHARSR